MRKSKAYSHSEERLLSEEETRKKQKKEGNEERDQKMKPLKLDLNIRAIVIAKSLEDQDICFPERFNTRSFKHLSFEETGRKIMAKISSFQEDDLTDENIAYAKLMLSKNTQQDELELAEFYDIVQYAEFINNLIQNCRTIDKIIAGDETIEDSAICFLAYSIYQHASDQSPLMYTFLREQNIVMYNEYVLRPLRQLQNEKLNTELIKIDRGLQTYFPISTKEKADFKDKGYWRGEENLEPNTPNEAEKALLGTIEEGDEDNIYDY